MFLILLDNCKKKNKNKKKIIISLLKYCFKKYVHHLWDIKIRGATIGAKPVLLINMNTCVL